MTWAGMESAGGVVHPIDDWGHLTVGLGVALGLAICLASVMWEAIMRRRYARQERRAAMIRASQQARALHQHLAWAKYFKGASDAPAIDLPSDP